MYSSEVYGILKVAGHWVSEHDRWYTMLDESLSFMVN